MTSEQDIVLIHYEDRPLGYARIESIDADHKRDWYHVKLLMLQVPLQVVTWTLRDVYIEGEEFTMGGKRMRLTKVECPPDAETQQPESKTDTNSQSPKTVTLDGTEGASATDIPAPPKEAPSQKPGKVIAFPPKNDG